MKSTFILFLLFGVLKIPLFAQPGKDSLIDYHLTVYFTNFESDYSFLHFDGSPYWQVGMPQKDFCDTAYSAPNVLATDTLGLVSGPSQASFILKYFRHDELGANCIWNFSFNFMTKYEFNDSSGMYFETSYNKGQSWGNIVDDTSFQGFSGVSFPVVILPNGQKGMSGQNLSWHQEGMGGNFPQTYSGAGSIYSIYLRTTFYNGSHQSVGGIVLDDIEFSGASWCEFLDLVENYLPQNIIKITSNPVKSDFTIDVSNIKTRRYFLNIYDINGRPILSRFDECEQKLHFSKGIFPKGIYMVVVKTAEGKMFTNKFVVEQ